MKVKRTERGWGGHFCDADRYQFRLAELKEIKRRVHGLIIAFETLEQEDDDYDE